MATVYLHIGLPKTGTTAIQSFLASNRDVLAKYNTCFPVFKQRYFRSDHYVQIDRVRNGHFLVTAWRSLTTDTPNAAYVAKLKRLVKLGKRYDKIILSDESLWLYGDLYPDSWLALKNDLEKNGLSLCVIAYLRRQDNFALSYYRQMIKSASTGLSFYDYLENVFKDKYQLDYYSHMEFLSGLLGKENVFFRVYERGQFKGDEHNIYSDFLDIMGIPLDDDFVMEKEVYNLSLDDSLLELKRTVNQLPSPDCYNQLLSKSLRALLNNRPSDKSAEKTSLFHPGDQQIYLNTFAESNSRFAREYLGREDGALFYEDKDIELPECQVSTEDLLHDTILYYATVTQKLDKQNEDLKRQLGELEKQFGQKLKEQQEEHQREQKDLEKKLKKEQTDALKALRTELVEVRENVLLYRLKRKYRHLKSKLRAFFNRKSTD